MWFHRVTVYPCTLSPSPPSPSRPPVRGPDKLELSQAVGSALQRDQRQPRLWEQLGHLYEQDGPKPDDPARSYPGPARPHNGYAAGPGPGGHFAPRPNQLLRVRDETRGWRGGWRRDGVQGEVGENEEEKISLRGGVEELHCLIV